MLVSSKEPLVSLVRNRLSPTVCPSLPFIEPILASGVSREEVEEGCAGRNCYHCDRGSAIATTALIMGFERRGSISVGVSSVLLGGGFGWSSFGPTTDVSKLQAMRGSRLGQWGLVNFPELRQDESSWCESVLMEVGGSSSSMECLKQPLQAPWT